MTLCNSSLVSNTFKANEKTFFKQKQSISRSVTLYERHIKAIKHHLIRGSVAQSG